MTKNILQIAKKVINIEKDGLNFLSKKINNNFLKAIKIIKKTKGKIVVTGIGKSGIIAKKFDDTL